MNWLHFFIWLAGLYILYYLVVILADTTLQRKTSALTSNELTFAENIAPRSVEHLPDKTEIQKPKAQPAMIGSGGVSLKGLFNLCREEAIIYTRPVSF